MEEAIRILFETSDAGREMKKAASTVLYYVRTNQLRPVAITPSGRRLFDPQDVVRFRDRLAGVGAKRELAGI